MTQKNDKTNKINQNCLLYTMVTGVWVRKSKRILFFRCVAMMFFISGSCQCYILKTKTKTQTNIEEQQQKKKSVLRNTRLVISPILSILIPHLNVFVSNNLHTSHLLYMQNIHLNKICNILIEIE